MNHTQVGGITIIWKLACLSVLLTSWSCETTDATLLPRVHHVVNRGELMVCIVSCVAAFFQLDRPPWRARELLRQQRWHSSVYFQSRYPRRRRHSCSLFVACKCSVCDCDSPLHLRVVCETTRANDDQSLIQRVCPSPWCNSDIDIYLEIWC